MKKIITISVVVLLALGFGFFLFKISPQEQQQTQNATSDFDLSAVKAATEPRALSVDDHIQGKPDAKNVLIAYEDFQCPSCAATADMLKQIPTEFTDTKFVFRYFPLYQIHKNAVVSAYAAEAAGAQNKYWEMHDLLFKNQNSWAELADPTDYFVQLAQQAGVSNIDQFKSDIANKKFKDRVQKDLVDSLSLNIPGTPTFFFNGHQLKNDDLAGLKKQAEQYYIK
ncbi:MAG: thioredoxin domain-containing protein [Candidatus Doudnabacteria bacterium]|nr:thioredoxin domain-containing protein [Candidatus Doudnabacteria bacterium]